MIEPKEATFEGFAKKLPEGKQRRKRRRLRGRQSGADCWTEAGLAPRVFVNETDTLARCLNITQLGLIMSCFPSRLCCPLSLLFIRRLPRLQHVGVQLPSLSNSLESSSFLMMLAAHTHRRTHTHSSIRMSFKMVKLQCSVLFHCVFRGYKNKNQFHLRYVFSILTITYCFLSITLLSPHLQANTLTQPYLKSDSSNHRPSLLSSYLPRSLSIHPLNFKCYMVVMANLCFAMSHHILNKP